MASAEFPPKPRSPPAADAPEVVPLPRKKTQREDEGDGGPSTKRKRRERGSQSPSPPPSGEELGEDQEGSVEEPEEDGDEQGEEGEQEEEEDGEDDALSLLMKRHQEAGELRQGISRSGHLTTNGKIQMDSAELWAVLFEHTFQQTYSLELFEQAFAVSPRICQRIWDHLSLMIPPKAFLFHRKHLLWALYHLRHYSTTDHTRFSVCGRTFRLWSWKMIEALFTHLDEVSLSNRFNATQPENHSHKIYLSITHFACKIRKPSDVSIQRDFFSADHKCFILKYEICSRSSDGRFCWAYGPAPGKISDQAFLKEGGLLELLGKDERLLSGERFVDHERIRKVSMLTQADGPQEGEVNPKGFFHSFHQRALKALKLLKRFECLGGVWRYEMAHHKVAFVACLHLTNLMIDDRSKN